MYTPGSECIVSKPNFLLIVCAKVLFQTWPACFNTAVREEVRDDNVIYLFTRDVENELAKEIWQLLIWATQTKATKITVEEAKKGKSKSFKQMVPEWLHNYWEVFEAENFNKLPPRRQWDHTIKLKEGIGPWSRVRVTPLSMKEHQILQEFWDENLKTGWIWPSKSLYASPFFFTLKQDGKLRLVQDYWQFNAITVPNKTPLPLIQEVIDWLHGVETFSKMDIRWGLVQQHQDKRGRWRESCLHY